MSNDHGAIYTGTVVHRRLRPKSHLLRYRVFTLLLDLDRLEETKRTLKVLAINGIGLLSFNERDHGDGRKRGLRDWVDARLMDAGVDPAPLRVRVLCYPRILGYVFNPLTVYFCEDADGHTAAVMYQVNNTMGERHTYVIPTSEAAATPHRHTCEKAMYVSPFTPMRSRYDFTIVPPGKDVCVVIKQSDDEGPLLNASFTGQARPLTDRSLLGAVVRHPLMTVKVIGGIHLEAFRLWRKGVPVFRHEPQPRGDVSIINPVGPKTRNEAL